MKILYEDTMPHGEVYFSQLGDAAPYSWQTLTPEQLKDVEVLAIRSTTKITPELLSQAKRLRTVATATAGINHMDIDFLESREIDWFSAGGCNAIAVAQYVVSGIMYAHAQGELDFDHIEVGIIGAGNVGTALAKYLDALCINYVLCDPPIESTDSRQFVSLQRALQCDVISLHVPFIDEGEFPTENLINAHRLDALGSSQWLINACRGEVIDEQRLLALKKANKGPQLILDVWLNEPNINTELIPHVRLATPHIAGHTDEGKIRGTQMVYDYLCQTYFHKRGCNNRSVININQFLPNLKDIAYGYGQKDMPISEFLQRIYDIHFDHRIFCKNMAKSPSLSTLFSTMRKQYQGRREYNAFRLTGECELGQLQKQNLQALGFTFLP